MNWLGGGGGGGAAVPAQITIQWQSKEVNTVLGKIIMRYYSTVTLLYH